MWSLKRASKASSCRRCTASPLPMGDGSSAELLLAQLMSVLICTPAGLRRSKPVAQTTLQQCLCNHLNQIHVHAPAWHPCRRGGPLQTNPASCPGKRARPISCSAHVAPAMPNPTRQSLCGRACPSAPPACTSPCAPPPAARRTGCRSLKQEIHARL